MSQLANDINLKISHLWRLGCLGCSLFIEAFFVLKRSQIESAIEADST